MVAVSSTWASDKLFETVRDLAQRLDSSVVVAHVAQASEQDDSEQDARARGEQTLATLTDRLSDTQIDCEGVLLFADDVARALLNAAKAQNATLLVIGGSGKGRMARLLAGDVPQAVIRSSEFPVLILPADFAGVV